MKFLLLIIKKELCYCTISDSLILVLAYIQKLLSEVYSEFMQYISIFYLEYYRNTYLIYEI